MVYRTKFIVMNRIKDIHVRFVPPVYEPLTGAVVENIDGSEVVITYRDVSFFFDQSRLEKLGHQNVVDFLSRLDARANELPKDVSAHDVKEFIKPRYVNSAADIQSWSKFLMERSDEIRRLSKERAEKASATEAHRRIDEFINALLNKAKE